MKKDLETLSMKIFSIRYLAFLFLLIFFISCKEPIAKKQNAHKAIPSQSDKYIKLHGRTMGTTYNVTYRSDEDLKLQVDSILIDLNNEVSTYIPSSIISVINRSSAKLCLNDTVFQKMTKCEACHFIKIFNRSKYIHKKTNGFFEPTIMPLVNYWGFGYKKKIPQRNASKDSIKKILKYVGFDNIGIHSNRESCKELIDKKNPNTEIDFSAIAKGYGVDLIAEFLRSKTINHFMIEIGGEVICSGTSPSDQDWTIGINTPEEGASLNDFSAILHLNNKALASSGNYRIYHEVDSVKYGHEINPISGYPEKNSLLSVSVIANTCMDADAFATAFMVMGLEKSKAFTRSNKEIEAFFIFGNEQGGMSMEYTEGFKSYFK